MQKFLFGLVGLLFSQWAIAQACFRVSPLKGCAPLTITITNCSSVNPQFYVFEPGQGGVNLTYTYTTPGKKKIIQFVGGTGIISDTIEVEVLPATKPEFEVTLCQGNGATVEITDPAGYDVFFVDYGQKRDTVKADESSFYIYPDSGAKTIEIQGNYLDTAGNYGSISCGRQIRQFSTLSQINPLKISRIISSRDSLFLEVENRPNLHTFLQKKAGNGFDSLLRYRGKTLAIPNPGDSILCLRVVVRDGCSGNDIAGREICSTRLTATVLTDRIELSWPRYPSAGFLRYSLYRGDSLIYATTNRNNLTFPDREVKCLQRYCYRLVISLSDGAVVVSDTVCAIALSNKKPPQPVLAAASVLSDSLVEIFWQVPAAAIARTYVVGEKGLILQRNAESAQDNQTLTQTRAYCYRLVFEDSCSNLSDSAEVCTIYLTHTKSKRDNVLQWTSFEGFDGSFSYKLEVFDNQGNLLRSIPGLLSESYTDPASAFTARIQRYRVSAVSDSQPQRVAYSNTIEIEEKHIILLPTAFTPNADGLNDVLLAFSHTAATFNLSIFNRWGEKVFFSTSLEQGWDGTYNGQNAPEGIYVVEIEGIDVFGEAYHLKQKVMLIR